MPTCSRQMHLPFQTPVVPSLSHPGGPMVQGGAAPNGVNGAAWPSSCPGDLRTPVCPGPSSPPRPAKRSGSLNTEGKSGKTKPFSFRSDFLEKAADNKEWMRLFRNRLDSLLRANRRHASSAPSRQGAASDAVRPGNSTVNQADRRLAKDADKRWGAAVCGRDNGAKQPEKSVCPPRSGATDPGNEKPNDGTSEETNPDIVGLSEAADTFQLQLHGRLCIPPLFKAAPLFGLDTNVKPHQQFLGVEENDMAFQRLLSNYFVHRLSPKLQQVALTLKMLPPHLPLFLGPENKPALKLSALTGAQVVLIGPSIAESHRNSRYLSDSTTLGRKAHHPNEFRQAELRGHIDAVLTAYVHVAYRLQHPLRKALAYCVLMALKQGLRAGENGPASPSKETDQPGGPHQSAMSCEKSEVPGNDGSETVEINSSRCVELVNKLLKMPPVVCESPAIVKGVAVENAPTYPLCIPQIARDEVWVLPLP
ncbi:hypothetical protein CSUI_003770 [Cystoisospora suis]|uniref:Uncharacterized protein n=1 Tax=Cystoisospora suis TaxID=483139 RepID=A0A2C6L3N8_9APIC|nr:hypothetical protein CSUI_003770 [Cystoisospora suis]